MIFDDDGDDETPWERTVTVCCARLAAKRARQYIDRRAYNREAQRRYYAAGGAASRAAARLRKRVWRARTGSH